MLGKGHPLECVALFNARKSTQKRYDPFFFGVSSIWDHAGASDGLIMLHAIAFFMNLSTSYDLAIVCHLGGCLFLFVIQSLSGFNGIEYGCTKPPRDVRHCIIFHMHSHTLQKNKYAKIMIR